MPRIRFEDENGKHGEIDMQSVRAGDVVRFNADFTKRADDDEDESVSVTVRGGDIGEVIEAFFDGPSLLVTAPCTVDAGGIIQMGDDDFMVEPGGVVVLVDSRDPRVGTARLLGSRMTPTELVAEVKSLALPAECFTRRIVAAALRRARLHRASEVVSSSSDAAWLDFVAEFRFTRTA